MNKTFEDSMEKSVDVIPQERANQRMKLFKELDIPDIGGILISAEGLYDLLMDPERRELLISKLKLIPFL